MEEQAGITIKDFYDAGSKITINKIIMKETVIPDRKIIVLLLNW